MFHKDVNTNYITQLDCIRFILKGADCARYTEFLKMPRSICTLQTIWDLRSFERKSFNINAFIAYTK
jgi:hypothetical protein